ncbi:glycoside hydrolase [Boletus reticuloceps]|uniref:Mannosyl-oligosaccharide glucosidase n=1 Tax=Boletus reticuloceps TaxID=495285 RepID=A0A8I3A8Q2_9AGAM|nr:glycoside hydrolase [Boletus reticuloceps]
MSNVAYPSRISAIFYLGLEGLGGIDLITDEDENGIDGPIEFSGATPDLGDFTIRVVDGDQNRGLTSGLHSETFAHRLGKSHLVGLRANPGQVWTAKDFIMQSILKHAGPIAEQYPQADRVPDASFILQLPDETVSASNLFAVQKFFDGEFQFDVFFDSASSHKKLDSATIDLSIPALVSSFDDRFESRFPTPDSFNVSNYGALKSFSKAITSSLLGGIGYFYGTSIINKGFAFEWDQDDDYDYDGDGTQDTEQGATFTEPLALFTATPSRSFFPRGFYWDEGFHLLHIGQWDNDLSLEILRDWINLIDENGWVAREQILGDEARSRVPPEFQTQVPTFA